MTILFSYLARWRRLNRAAWLYLGHAALLTGSLAMAFLVFNLAIVALDLPPVALFGLELPFLGILGSLSVAVAGLLALPLLWLINRCGFWWALLANTLIQSASMFLFALWPDVGPLLLATALTGIGGVLFQVSSVPFMIAVSDEATRDHLFSANFAVNIGVSAPGTLLAGWLAALASGIIGWLPGVEPGGALAYRIVFFVAGVGLLLALVPLLQIGPGYRRRPRPTRPQPEADPPAPSRPRPVAMDSAGRANRWAALVARLPLTHRIPQPWYGLVTQPWPLLRLLVSPLLISCGAALLIPYLNLFFLQRFGVDDATLGTILATLGLATGLAALAGPLLSVRLGKMRTIVLTQALSLPFLLVLGLAPILGLALAAALGRTTLFNLGSPLYDAFAMERTEEELRPAVIGAINGAFALGYIVMPLVSTLVQDYVGFAPLFAGTAICYSLATFANYWLFIRSEVIGDGL